MGEAKDTVKGSGPPKKQKKKGILSKKTEGPSNVIERIDECVDDLTDAIEVKTKDCATEGKGELPENMRKLALMRAATTIIRTAKQLLEEY